MRIKFQSRWNIKFELNSILVIERKIYLNNGKTYKANKDELRLSIIVSLQIFPY